MNIKIKSFSVVFLFICIVILFSSCTMQDENRAFITVNENVPHFEENEITTESFESYSDLDDLGRCGPAIACIGKDLMPTEERGAIGQVKPSGWQMAKYDIVDGKYLYNRCHLIGYQLSGENANEKNLITGTRYMNMEGMLPFENMVATYIEETDNHVMYRVTPIFTENNMLADGVQIEALSVEDNGKGVSFNVFVYNMQPGIEINYLDGTSKLESDSDFEETVKKQNIQDEKNDTLYILNTNTMKFHSKDCSSIKDIKPKNKESYNGTKAWLIDNGYSSCGICNP